MKETRAGVFSRGKSPYVEIEAKRSDTYREFACNAASKCRLKARRGMVLSLFKLNGARVLDQPVTMKGKAKPWTLGNYLLLMKKGASSVKMGVAYTAPLQSDSSSASDDDEDAVSDCQANDDETSMPFLPFFCYSTGMRDPNALQGGQ